MKAKRLSIFIDESGDFGEFDARKPCYYVAMITHDQSVNIADKVQHLESQMKYIGFEKHAIHAGPLIRREAVYRDIDRETRRKLFNTLCHFLRVVDIAHTTICLEKHKGETRIEMQARLTRVIAQTLREKAEYFNRFDEIIVYYDNGQIELTRTLVAVFNTLFSNVEFRKVQPKDYVLFQCADLICTLELVARKFRENLSSKSELEFFKSARDFKKKYLTHLTRKTL